MFPFRRRPPPEATPLERTFAYHEATKHHFDRYAAALGYLDWATQPAPFRRYLGAEVLPLQRDVPATPLTYDALFDGPHPAPSPLTLTALADLLRHALSISAWKRFQTSRWALRVNPSSGNLHPTEGYLVLPAGDAWGDAGVFHYAPDQHVLERRARIAAATFATALPQMPEGTFLIGLSSVVWREAWKYGERAFRYCQHDIGHALAALRFAAAMLGWRLQVQPHWSSAQVSALFGLDRDGEFVPQEREEAELVALVGPRAATLPAPDADALAAWRASAWFGSANRLSREHHPWPILGDVAEATRALSREPTTDSVTLPAREQPRPPRPLQARDLVLQRRSAVAMDGRTFLARDAFAAMLERTLPRGEAPFDSCPWPPHVHLALFVHRVHDVAPGLYLLLRAVDPVAALNELRTRLRSEFVWRPVDGLAHLPLYLLREGNERDAARAISCHQEIAADGCFALGMLAQFASTLQRHGADSYRALFWETGVIGQVLYLEAEAAGVRATGIGCFFDDAMHDLLGLRDGELQSLYHFTVGGPVDDVRLTSEPGYGAE